MWLQQLFPREQDEHREGSELLLLLGFAASQSERALLSVHVPAAGAERGATIAELGFCLLLNPLGALWHLPCPNSCPRHPQSPAALASVLHLTQGINCWLCLSQPSAPGRKRLGKVFSSKKKLQDTVLVGFKEKEVDISAFNSMWKVLHRASANSAGVGSNRRAPKLRKGLNA